MRAAALLAALLALNACAGHPIPPTESMAVLASGKAHLTCADLAALRSEATDMLEEAYATNKGVIAGQKILAAGSVLFPPIALAAMGAGLAKGDTRQLRIFSDRAQDELNARLLIGACGNMLTAKG